MARKISVQARQELIQAIGERYRASSRQEKLRILDELVAVTGYHRKHSIRLLNTAAAAAAGRRPRLRLYDEAVREALIVLWEASDRVCGKRLKPLLPVLVEALERHGHLRLDRVVRAKLHAASASTLDRLLAEPRTAIGRRHPARPVPAIRRAIAVRTFADWKEPLPGYMEADLVAHGGESVEGSFAHTLVLTDIASGWTECVALAVREGSLVVEALERLRTTMPFPLRGLDTDNGSEFINDAVLVYCTEAGIEFTRSRPYRKNDQAWVEQKNGSVVRRLVGYRRLEGIAAAEALSQLYAASRLFVNFFQPSFKLAEKKRVGPRVSRRYHAPETPCARLLRSDAVPEAMKERLRAVATTLDPLRLLDEIRGAQHRLAGLAAGESLHVVPRGDAELDQFLRNLATAWHEGEVRPTHRSQPKPRRDWRTRKDPFETVWPRILGWLRDEPDRTAVELLHRLHDEYPGKFSDGQVRTLQRRLRLWRRAAARRLVFTEDRAPFTDGRPLA
ncbi:MAG: transposase family protein [Deltaproteobacteria bacterium]|nr:transposase family protein [Deltaproteobacteria bacterium]